MEGTLMVWHAGNAAALRENSVIIDSIVTAGLVDSGMFRKTSPEILGLYICLCDCGRIGVGKCFQLKNEHTNLLHYGAPLKDIRSAAAGSASADNMHRCSWFQRLASQIHQFRTPTPTPDSGA
jgi:hypothetical protein